MLISVYKNQNVKCEIIKSKEDAHPSVLRSSVACTSDLINY